MHANRQPYNRRDFLKHAGVGLLAAGALAGLGCEEVDLNNPAGAAGEATNQPPVNGGVTNQPAAEPVLLHHNDAAGNISNNHGHSVTLSGAQQDAGDAVTLELTPGNGHTHNLELEAVQVQAVAEGRHNVARETSVTLGHSHTVSFN